MKSIVFKALSVIVACAGVLVSIIELHSAALCLGFALGGVIAYELAEIIRGKKQ